MLIVVTKLFNKTYLQVEQNIKMFNLEGHCRPIAVESYFTVFKIYKDQLPCVIIIEKRNNIFDLLFMTFGNISHEICNYWCHFSKLQL